MYQPLFGNFSICNLKWLLLRIKDHRKGKDMAYTSKTWKDLFILFKKKTFHKFVEHGSHHLPYSMGPKFWNMHLTQGIMSIQKEFKLIY
jgi:hypothetical protein